MPIAIEARENGRVLLIRITDPWNTDDMDRAAVHIGPHFEQARQPVYFFVEMSLARGIPPRYLIRIGHEPLLAHPNFGGAVFVNAGAVAQAIIEVATVVFHLKPVRFFNSEDDAWTHLRANIVEP